MAKKQIVSPHPDGWSVKGYGNKRASKISKTQKEAINKAKKIAKKQSSEVLIKGKDGRFRESNSYGNDPYPPKG
ncbi:DUF2188 domain-containing protein [Halocola ammonii]